MKIGKSPKIAIVALTPGQQVLKLCFHVIQGAALWTKFRLKRFLTNAPFTFLVCWRQTVHCNLYWFRNFVTTIRTTFAIQKKSFKQPLPCWTFLLSTSAPIGKFDWSHRDCTGARIVPENWGTCRNFLQKYRATFYWNFVSTRKRHSNKRKRNLQETIFWICFGQNLRIKINLGELNVHKLGFYSIQSHNPEECHQ
jgi:hypothetical protein